MADDKKKSPEDKKKAEKKDNALRRFILNVTGANKITKPMDEANAKNKRKKDEEKT